MTENESQQRSGERRAADRENNTGGRRLRQSEMLLQTYSDLSTLDTLDEVLEKLVEIVARETGGEYATLFLHDDQTGELYSRVMYGKVRREIRFLDSHGIAGHVFSSGHSEIIPDAYEDPRFNRRVDEKTGLVTRNILCSPIRTAGGEIIGVAQSLNKREGHFTAENLAILQALTTHAAIFLQSTQFAEQVHKSRLQELEFLNMVSGITSEIDLSAVLKKVMSEATHLLNAERSTLFLNDEKSNELWSEVGGGLDAREIRFPNHQGIAGAVFESGQTVNIPHAYADLRFNPEVDRQTGFFTRSILCVPVINKEGKTIGVTQVLNKRGGTFTQEDESRLKAFTAQVSIGLENAKLFKDVQNMKRYTDGMLTSMSNGVLTLDELGAVVTCNRAAETMLKVSEAQILGTQIVELFDGSNEWLPTRIDKVRQTIEADSLMDVPLCLGDVHLSVNLTIQPLRSEDDEDLGIMLMLEDITSEKRVKSTMARYMDPMLADQLTSEGEELLGGKSTEATVLFTDIRGFTTITEELGAQGTVSLLNEYFTIMVECIQQQGGMLDKFIGDAMMSAFGIPVAHGDDADRAVRAAIDMIRSLDQWNHQRASRRERPIDMGIGINTDTIVSGNIGSARRMDYTMIGDGVNLAARLESACKEYFSRILISENTYNKLQGTYRIREIDRVVVKGKTQPVAIFEVLDFHTEQSFPNLMEAVGHFKEGQLHYRTQNWDKAMNSFQTVLSINPADRLSQTYIARCEHLRSNPPGDDWDSVWVMTSK